MKSATFLIQAHHHTPQVITCGITDQLVRNFPVPVVFFYRQSIHHQLLIDALQKVLSDFPLFAGTLNQINGNLAIDCNNNGVLFSINQQNCTLEQLLHQLPRIKKKTLVTLINPKQVVSHQRPPPDD